MEIRHERKTLPAFDCMSGFCRTPGCPGYPRGDGRTHGIGSERHLYVTIADHRTGPVAVSFDYATGTYHEATPRSSWSEPMALDIGHHTTVALYPEQWRSEDCDWLGGRCYYDGSGLQADRYLSILQGGGEASLWAALDARLHEVMDELDESIRTRGGVLR